MTQNQNSTVRRSRKAQDEDKARTITVSGLDIALLHALEPVINVLDQNHPAELGHEAPSRKDGLLRILLNNFCRDVHQQIYGVTTEKYKFAGVKDNWDRAQAAVAQLVNRYSNNPEDMDADPNCVRFNDWYESANAKFEMLTSMLADLKGVYKTVTGEDWEYKAPGTTATTSTIDPAEAAKRLRERIASSKKSAAA